MEDEKKKPFSGERWHEPLKPTVIGHRELTEEEKKLAEERMKEIIKFLEKSK